MWFPHLSAEANRRRGFKIMVHVSALSGAMCFGLPFYLAPLVLVRYADL